MSWPPWRYVLAGCAVLGGCLPCQARATTPAPWREAIHAFAVAHLLHSAWGLAHAQRDYEGTVRLAREEGVAIDTDVVYAAAFLHDLAAIPPYDSTKLDHADRAVELVGPILRDAGFPMHKLAHVQEVIRGHMFSRVPGPSAEARLFHDTDTLDFLGAIGIARVISLTDSHSATSLRQSIDDLRASVAELPKHLTSAAARREAVKRVAQMRAFLDALSTQTDSLTVL